jgi:hypothetical protein
MQRKFVSTAVHITVCEQVWVKQLRGMSCRFKTLSSIRIRFDRKGLRKILDELKFMVLLNCFSSVKAKNNSTVVG